MRKIEHKLNSKKRISLNSEILNSIDLNSHRILKRILLISVMQFFLFPIMISVIKIVIFRKLFLETKINTTIVFLEYFAILSCTYFFVVFIANFRNIIVGINLNDLLITFLKTRKNILNYFFLGYIFFTLNMFVFLYLCLSKFNLFIKFNLPEVELFACFLALLGQSVILFLIWFSLKIFYLRLLDKLTESLNG